MTRTYPDGWSTPPRQLTIDEVAKRHSKSNPEFLRRVMAMMVDCPTSLGIGESSRSSAQQEAVFRQRYVPYTVPPGIFWDGAWWRKKNGVAAAAPPGRSYHEDDIPGGSLAVDMIGDLKWMKAACANYGLREFSQVNSEPWHVQPAEIPTARSAWDGTPIQYIPLPSDPKPPTDDEDDMAYLAIPPTERHGKPWLYVSSSVRPATTFDINDGVPQRKMDDIPAEYRAQQYDDLYKAAGLG